MFDPAFWESNAVDDDDDDFTTAVHGPSCRAAAPTIEGFYSVLFQLVRSQKKYVRLTKGACL